MKLINPFEASEVHGTEVINDILGKELPQNNGYQIFYNVNFPPTAAADVRGVKYVKQGLRPNSFSQQKLINHLLKRFFICRRREPTHYYE